MQNPFDLITQNELKHLQSLLEKSPHSLGSVDPCKETLAIWSVRSRNLPALKLLQSLGADLEKGGRLGWNPLIHAVVNNEEAIVEQLLKWEVNTECYDQGYWTPVLFASLLGNDKILQMLAKSGANLERYVYDGKTPLTICAERGYVGCLRVLFKWGANLQAALPVVHSSKHPLMSDLKRKQCVEFINTTSL